MYRTDSLSQISQIGNHLRKIEIAEVDYIGRYKLGRRTKGSEEKIGIFTGLPDSRCMFSISFPKEKRG